MLKIKKLCFAYGKRQVLKEVSFRLKKGEIGSLIGTSGSGKTTIFNLLTGMINPRNGEIIIDGKSLPEGQGKASYMMQEDLLLPWRTVLKNMTLIAELGKGGEKDQLCRHARELLEEMQLTNYSESYPNELSGGMRQRVSLARALLLRRPLLLLDEPFGSLDVSLREQMYSLLRQIQQKYGSTILLITHDFRDAITLSDQIFLLAKKKIVKEWRVSDAIRNDPQASGILHRELSDTIKESAPNLLQGLCK